MLLMLIDTHAHVNFVAYKDDGDEVTKRALKENIWMINVGSEYDTSRRAVKYAKKHSQGVYAAIGLHPIHLKEQKINAQIDEYEAVEFKTGAERFDYERYKALVLSASTSAVSSVPNGSGQANEKVVAIGEIGLDYYRNAENKLLQKEALLEQMSLADELNKPIIFHCREAHNDLLATLKQWDMVGNKKLRGVIHSFSGRWSQAEQYLAMGFYLGFNGIITFARDYDKVIKQMPLEKLLLETDCPYLTPVPFRGKRNEPAYVKFVAEKIAELRGISFEEVAETTTKNAKALFKI